jgi:Skp family chaperone for outer membrane proteins
MTQKNLIIAALCAICVGLLGFSLGVNRFLIPSGALKVAVVDGDRLKNEARAFRVAHDILIVEQSKAHEEMMPIEKELLKEQEAIRLEAKKNPESAKKRKEAFDIRLAEVNKKVQKKSDLLYKQRDYLSETIQEMVFSIINEIAKKQNISIVFNTTIDEKRSVFFAEKRMDLTDAVVSALNERLKNLKLPEIKE